jgi:hypothetical protein
MDVSVADDRDPATPLDGPNRALYSEKQSTLISGASDVSDYGDELAAIRRMMDDAQHATEDNGKYFVTWGGLTSVGLLATYVAVVRKAPFPALWVAWAVLVALGWILSVRWGQRDEARARARTIASTMVAESWAGIGIAVTVLVFAGAASGTIPPQALPGVVSALIGAGTFASASVYRQLPLRVIALLWWAGALVMLLRPGVYSILLMGALVLALLVGPGLLLWMRARAAERSADAA